MATDLPSGSSASPEAYDFSPQSGAEAVGAVAALRDQAVEEVNEAIFDRMGDQLAPFGERGRAMCRQDLHSHLDYLNGALVAGQAGLFGDYLLWLEEVLAARSVPTDSLTLSVDLLADFMRRHLDPARLEPVAAVLASGSQALAGSAPEAGASRALGEPESVPPRAAELADALVQGDRLQGRAILEAETARGGYLATALEVVQPAMQQIGQLWRDRRISVAQEHLATAHVQRLLTEQFVHESFQPPRESKALFACLPGNNHEVGLRIVADAFELAGWQTEFLGADTPEADLVERVDQWRPELVGLSAALVRQLPEMRAVVARLRAEFGEQCPYLLGGGGGLERLPGAALGLGLDAYHANPQAALEALS